MHEPTSIVLTTFHTPPRAPPPLPIALLQLLNILHHPRPSLLIHRLKLLQRLGHFFRVVPTGGVERVGEEKVEGFGEGGGVEMGERGGYSFKDFLVEGLLMSTDDVLLECNTGCMLRQLQSTHSIPLCRIMQPIRQQLPPLHPPINQPPVHLPTIHHRHALLPRYFDTRLGVRLGAVVRTVVGVVDVYGGMEGLGGGGVEDRGGEEEDGGGGVVGVEVGDDGGEVGLVLVDWDLMRNQSYWQ